MQPSSLIFLVIIAIWAAYFIQHWVRRREHLATARSVDRFSESMRVLEHRAALPGADLSVPPPRSYAVSPARAARPEILVKRAGSAPASAETGDAGAAARAAAAQAASATASAPRASVAPSRRVRGLTLLGSLAAVLLVTGLAAFGVLPWLAVLVPVAAVGGALAWVRSGVRAEQAARRPVRSPQAAPADRAPDARGAVAARPARTATTRNDTRVTDTRPDQAPTEPVAVRDSFYDVEAVERAAGPAVVAEAPAAELAPGRPVPVGPLVDEDDIPLTWDPVPVPRPTYTMKAAAPRTQAPPVAPGVPPELADAAYDEPVRRAAGA